MDVDVRMAVSALLGGIAGFAISVLASLLDFGFSIGLSPDYTMAVAGIAAGICVTLVVLLSLKQV